MYELLADVITVIHASIIVGIAIGIGMSIFRPRLRLAQLGVVIGVILVWFVCGGCPLTFLESSLRAHTANPIPLAQIGFIPYYSQHWFGVMVADQLVKTLLYISAGALSLLVVLGRYRIL